MNTYYRMTTAQKDGVLTSDLDCLPYSNIAGDEWIVEAYTTDYDCIDKYESAETCIDYLNGNMETWDELRNV